MPFNVHEVVPGLYVSGRPPASAKMMLHQLGFTTVLNLTQKNDPIWDMPTLNDGQPDDGQPRTKQWWSRGLRFIHSAISKPHSKILVHCESGIHRGPSMAYAYLRSCGWNEEDAAHQVISKVPGASLRYAADYERYHDNNLR